MNTLETIKNRRSTKNFKPDPVSEEILEKIIEAGIWAPTGKNRQAPIIIAVTDKATRDMLSRMNAQVLGADIDPFYGAPVVLVVLSDKQVNTYVHDGSLVMGNLMLAAHELGVGSCWIHRAREMFASEEGKAILKELGIEGDYEGVGNCILGYADCPQPEARPRKENYIYYIR